MGDSYDPAVLHTAYARLKADGDERGAAKVRAMATTAAPPKVFADLGRPIGQSDNHEALAAGLRALSTPEHAYTRQGSHPEADHIFRGQLADILQDHGRDEEAGLIRGNRPVFVHQDQVRAVPKSVEIRGRRWFQRSAGNTYHTAHAFIDGNHVLSLPRQYGYGHQYLHSAMDALESNGLIPPRERYKNGGQEASHIWAQRHGINLDYSHEDVPRQKDLNAPPPPSQYQPPAETFADSQGGGGAAGRTPPSHAPLTPPPDDDQPWADNHAQNKAAFEKAIDANPLDSHTHLIYADYLQDHATTPEEQHEAEFRRSMGNWIGNGGLKKDPDQPRASRPWGFRLNLADSVPEGVDPYKIPFGRVGYDEDKGETSFLPSQPAYDPKNPRERESIPLGHSGRSFLLNPPPNHGVRWSSYRDMESAFRHAFMAGKQRPA